MAFKVIGSVTNEYFKPVIKSFPIVSTAMNMGALVTKTAGTATLALANSSTAITVWGVTNHPVASSATGSALIELCPTGTIFEADVTEIANATTITGASGSGSGEFASAAVPGADNVFIGATLLVVSNAADSTINGTTKTVTDSTSSSGKIAITGTYAETTSTMKWKTLSNVYAAGWGGPDVSSTADTITLEQTASAAGLFKVIGTNSDGTKLWMVLLNGVDSPKAVTGT